MEESALFSSGHKILTKRASLSAKPNPYCFSLTGLDKAKINCKCVLYFFTSNPTLSSFLPVYLSKYLLVLKSTHLSFSTCLIIYPSTYLQLNLSMYLSTNLQLNICLPVYLSTCLPVYLSTCLPVYLPTCLPVYLSTCKGSRSSLKNKLEDADPNP